MTEEQKQREQAIKEQKQREHAINVLAEMMRYTPVTIEYAVKKKPEGIKVIIEVAREQMDGMLKAAYEKQKED